MKINSLNNFINFIFQKKIIKIKQIIASKYNKELDKIHKINKKKFFIFFLKNYYSYNIITANKLTRNLINITSKVGIINPLQYKINNNLFSFFFLLIMTYSFFGKIKFLSRLFFRKII